MNRRIANLLYFIVAAFIFSSCSSPKKSPDKLQPVELLNTSPEEGLQQYFNAMANGDKEGAYKCLSKGLKGQFSQKLFDNLLDKDLEKYKTRYSKIKIVPGSTKYHGNGINAYIDVLGPENYATSYVLVQELDGWKVHSDLVGIKANPAN